MMISICLVCKKKLAVELRIKFKFFTICYGSKSVFLFCSVLLIGLQPGAVARSDARPPGMRTVAGSNLTSDKIFLRGDLVLKKILRLSQEGQLSECAQSTGKLPRRLVQEQCGQVN